ncbi:hypothetical protein [Streptomyces sp. NPDC059003]|uniref:hypothetical protein n=1 Tax=Streptomyces sp. NPDC059003 TaxID=3346691 RepID=UPI00367729F8
MTASAPQATAAAPLAALLPTRQGKPWTVGPAPYGIRNNAATSRITDGRRALIVVEDAGRVELFADRPDRPDRPDRFPVTPDAVVDSTDPVSVAALAARALRWILPRLDADAAQDMARKAVPNEQPWQWVMRHKGAALTEVGFALVQHGTHPVARERLGGPGLTWTADSGAECEWGVWAYGAAGNFHLTYDGPVSGLYGALPVLLPPLDERVCTKARSAFAQYLTDRFPQLHPANDGEVEFGGRQDLSGWVALPSRTELRGPVHDGTPVCAQVGSVGVDFLLAIAPHLI